MKENERVRLSARANKTPLWLLAESVGISEATMNRKLRNDISCEEAESLIAVIKELSNKRGTHFMQICSVSELDAKTATRCHAVNLDTEGKEIST